MYLKFHAEKIIYNEGKLIILFSSMIVYIISLLCYRGSLTHVHHNETGLQGLTLHSPWNHYGNILLHPVVSIDLLEIILSVF
jgi:hypothetical protein